jgi:hypothetical protein
MTNHLSHWAPRDHPSQFSPEVLDVIRPLLRPGERVHDPLAGPGVRLATLCDWLGCPFTGTDIEVWLVPLHDPRVIQADARDATSYPPGPFTVITSPTYLNVRLADYSDGPTSSTKFQGRRDYALALGQPLSPDNLARQTGYMNRPQRANKYWHGHRDIVKHWGDRVILNVDLPIAARWQQLLTDAGYTIDQVIPAHTQRYGGLDNADKRAEHEVVIVTKRSQPTPKPRRLIRKPTRTSRTSRTAEDDRARALASNMTFRQFLESP